MVVNYMVNTDDYHERFLEAMRREHGKEEYRLCEKYHSCSFARDMDKMYEWGEFPGTESEKRYLESCLNHGEGCELYRMFLKRERH